MKHEFKVTIFLILLFLASQAVGLLILKSSLVEVVGEDGIRAVVFDEAKVGEVPQLSGLGFLLYVGIGVGIGTALVLLLVRFKKANWWRAWFFLAVLIAIDYALKTFLNEGVAALIAFILAVWKIYRPNVVVHNSTEVLMYSGIAVFLVPLLNSVNNAPVLGIAGNVFWAIVLLLIISVYDFIAVFKSRHMVSMAKFQTDSKVFAGLLIPYSSSEGQAIRKAPGVKSAAQKAPKDLKLPGLSAPERKNAILGGGDIAFPLIFSGTVLYWLANSMPLQDALMRTFIITATTAVSLTLLFVFAKKDKFYPAMPILTAGCLVGYGIILLI